MRVRKRRASFTWLNSQPDGVPQEPRVKDSGRAGRKEEGSLFFFHPRRLFRSSPVYPSMNSNADTGVTGIANV